MNECVNRRFTDGLGCLLIAAELQTPQCDYKCVFALPPFSFNGVIMQMALTEDR